MEKLIEMYKPVLDFLEDNNFNRSVKALKEELFNQQNKNRENLGITLQEKQNSVLKIIKKAIQNAQREDKEKMKRLIPNASSNKFSLFTPQETQNIMQNLMNKMVRKQNLTNDDEQYNEKLLNFSNSSVFKALLVILHQFLSKFSQQKSNYLQDQSISIGRGGGDVGDSFSNTNTLQKIPDNKKNNQQNLPIDQKFDKCQDEPNQDDLPHFGNANGQIENQVLFEDELRLSNKFENENQKCKINQQSNKAKKGAGLKDISNFELFDQILQQKQMKEFYEQQEQMHGQEKVSESFQQVSQQIPALKEPYIQYEGDEYESQLDPGFDLYEVSEEEFQMVIQQLVEYYGFPQKTIKIDKNLKEFTEDLDPDHRNKLESKLDDSGEMLQKISKNGSVINKNNKKQQTQNNNGNIRLPSHLKHPVSNNEFYPLEFQGTIFDCYNMKIIYDRERTGFEETKEFPIVINSVIAGRYQIISYLGSAAFSKAIQCLDLLTNEMVCMKIIENNKDYFDQSIDEIKLLKFINLNCDVEQKHILRFIDFFYHKEHLFIVTELLKENLYEYQKFNLETQNEKYFTVGRIQKIAKQVLEGLEYLHSLKIIHSDLKPENLLIKSVSKCDIKVIDFGSSCFIFDNLSTYVQSRSYRAPEVIMGCKYGYKIDIWSLGCILAEMHTGIVLFQSDSVHGLLAKVAGIIGPFPEWMIKTGKLTNQIFLDEGLIYTDTYENDGSNGNGHQQMFEIPQRRRTRTGKYNIFVPKNTKLQYRLQTDDLDFVEFIKFLLNPDSKIRPTASEALKHPFLKSGKYPDGL